MPETNIKSERLLSLDVMRGAVVVGMIVVNSVAYLKQVDGLGVFPALLHAEWAGFTVADFVFPSFVFVVGVSISVSLRNAATSRATLLRIAARSARLFLAGLIVSNLEWATDWDQNGFRVMGVLQRIGLCYFASGILFLTLSARWRVILAFAILLLYWPATLLPMPGGPGSDLSIIGANFVSWTDRAIFGSFNFVNGPLGFDPEGLLGTLPAIAQCLLGVAAGEWLWKNAQRKDATRNLALAGVAVAVAGFGWSFFFPFIKALWTSSYVLYSTGLAMIVLSLCRWLFDIKQWRGRGTVATFFAAFGVNAIFAYIVHEFASPMLQCDLLLWFAETASHALSAWPANLVPVVVFVLLIWIPLRYLQRRGWVVGI